MKFSVSQSDIVFEIPDDWWSFTEASAVRPGVYYRYQQAIPDLVIPAPLIEVEPPRRDLGAIWFRKYKMCPVLFAFASPECALPPVWVNRLPPGGQYKFRVANGFHRFYASVAVGYADLPTLVHPEAQL